METLYFMSRNVFVTRPESIRGIRVDKIKSLPFDAIMTFVSFIRFYFLIFLLNALDPQLLNIIFLFFILTLLLC